MQAGSLQEHVSGDDDDDDDGASAGDRMNVV